VSKAASSYNITIRLIKNGKSRELVEGSFAKLVMELLVMHFNLSKNSVE